VKKDREPGTSRPRAEHPYLDRADLPSQICAHIARRLQEERSTEGAEREEREEGVHTVPAASEAEQGMLVSDCIGSRLVVLHIPFGLGDSSGRPELNAEAGPVTIRRLWMLSACWGEQVSAAALGLSNWHSVSNQGCP
jgi:hypothetical protein